MEQHPPAAGFRDQHDGRQLGDETAVVVPVDEYWWPGALQHRASANDLDVAEADAVLQQCQEWVAAVDFDTELLTLEASP